MNQKKSSCQFDTLLKEAGHPPVVFNHAIDSWSAREWTLSYLAARLKNTPFQCKISPRDCEEVLMETDCLHVQCSLSQYEKWLSGQPGEDNPLTLFDPAKYSCYVDYKYMKAMFTDCQDILKDVDWGSFGFPGRDGTDSTIWIGSTGAYTPCHKDTYGFNLVAQISGRKRWYLFPPSASDNMYPTRIPFEESSVFSEVNVRYPDLMKHPLFEKAEPFVVILSPGEVLYVPRHWWHFVECLEPSISVNTWVEMREDVKTHLQEAVTRFLFTSMASLVPTENLLNSYEELESHETNIQYIKDALEAVQETRAGNQASTKDKCRGNRGNKTQTSDTNLAPLDSPQLLPETCCSTTMTNNFQQFVEAFKGLTVTVSTGNIGSICKNSERRNKRKRCDLDSGEEDINRKDSLKSKGRKSVYSDIAKHVDGQAICQMEGDFGDLESIKSKAPSSLDSVKTVLSDSSIQNVSTTGKKDEQNSEFLIKTETDLKTIHLWTVPRFSFDDYTEFLKLEFEFDKAEYTQTDIENHDKEMAVNTGTKSAENDSITTETLNVKIMNSILDESVVEVICKNLLKKC